MPAIPYVPSAISEPGPIVEAIRKRRGGTLLNLDRMLLHSPPFAEGWNHFLGAVRTQLALPPQLRELAICAVGHLNQADYEVFQHAPVFLAAGGRQAQLDALRADPLQAANDTHTFDTTERLVLAITIELTRDAHVSQELLAGARETLGDDRQVVELVGVIAAYNMVSRFLVALGVAPE